MKRSKFTDEQILAIVKEGEAGRKVADLCWTHGITEQTYYRSKEKYGGMELSEMQRHEPEQSTPWLSVDRGSLRSTQGNAAAENWNMNEPFFSLSAFFTTKASGWPIAIDPTPVAASSFLLTKTNVRLPLTSTRMGWPLMPFERTAQRSPTAGYSFFLFFLSSS